MFKFVGRHFYDALALSLVVGALFTPITSVIGVLIIFSAKLVDKYFTSSITDQDRKDIEVLKSEFQKLKSKNEAHDLAKAFQGRS